MQLEQLWNNKRRLCRRRNQLQSSSEKEPAKCGPRMTPTSHLLWLWKPLPHKQPQSSENLNYSCKYPEPCGYPRPLLHTQVNKAPLYLKTSFFITPSFHLPTVHSLCLKSKRHRLDPRRRLITASCSGPHSWALTILPKALFPVLLLPSAVVPWSRWRSRKTLSSPPLTGTPRLQLFTEHLLMKKTRIYPKGSLTTKDLKKKPQQDRKGGVTVQSRFIHPGGQPTNWRIITVTEVLPKSTGSEPHIGPPSPGVLGQKNKPLEHLSLKAKGA